MDVADRIKADYTETSATDGKSVEHLLATRIYDELVVPNDAGAIGAGADCPEGITLSASIADPTGPKAKCGCV